MSTHYVYENQAVPMADSVVFVQILDTSKLRHDSKSKMRQWENVARSIQGVIPIAGSRITDYRLFYGNREHFGSQGLKPKDLTNVIQSFLDFATTKRERQ